LHGFSTAPRRIQSKWKSELDFGDDGPEIEYAARPYPSGGSAYALELYLAVANCEGLARGFYHYDADRHALVPIAARTHELDAMLTSAEFAMDAPAPPQILITIAARFRPVAWKYSSIAYALVLKDVGVLIQTFYLMATDMGSVLRDREQQHRSVRKDHGDRIPRRGPGRSIRHRSRQDPEAADGPTGQAGHTKAARSAQSEQERPGAPADRHP